MLNEYMNVVFVGHVDHGKSTIVGRLLAETGTIPLEKLKQIKEFCELSSKPFEYAFLLDALRDERSQGITIDIARCFFQTNKRKYLLLDAPGHIEFLKNLVTGAANAEAAFLVLDAKEGIQENTRRHAYMLSLLDIKQVVILVNKIDLIDYDYDQFIQLQEAFSDYLKNINIHSSIYIPVSGREGDNIAELSDNTPWYKGLTVLDTLDCFEKRMSEEKNDFRMHVQDIYKFTKDGDDRRIVAGQISSGILKVGDPIIFHPSGKRSTVKSIEAFNEPAQSSVRAGQSTGFTLHEQIYVERGDVVSVVGQSAPNIASTLKVSLFWLGQNPLICNKIYWLKLGTTKIKVTVEAISHVLDTSSLEIRDNVSHVETNQAAECILKLFMPVAYDDIAKNPTMGRFVLVDNYHIVGGGIIQTHVEDDKSKLQQQLYQRNYKWTSSSISLEEREQVLKQKSQLILISGDCSPELRKEVAIHLEKSLFIKGLFAYFIGIGNVKHALESTHDISGEEINEHFKRFCEVLHILLDTGLIIIATAARITMEKLTQIEMITGHTNVKTFWLVSGQNNKDDEHFVYINGNQTLDAVLFEIQSKLKFKIV